MHNPRRYIHVHTCTLSVMCLYVAHVLYITSAKVIQLNEWGCRDGMPKIVETRKYVYTCTYICTCACACACTVSSNVHVRCIQCISTVFNVYSSFDVGRSDF